jgi:hypothetical protein
MQAERLTIYCTQADRHGNAALYEWLVSQALELDMGGATVTHAMLGFGQHRRLHYEHLLTLADDLPVVVQLIDEAVKIEAYLDHTAGALRGYTYIRESVRWHQPSTD